MVLDGFIVGLSNPKSIVFFGAVLPQFVQPGAAPATTQLLVLDLVAIGVVLLSDSMWALVAGAAREWFVNSRAALPRSTVSEDLR